MQDACLALLKATGRFDETRASWKTFAGRRANGAITDALRAQADTWPRGIRRWRREIAAAQDRLRVRLEREPLGDEVAQELGWTYERYEIRTARIHAIEAMASSDEVVGVPEWMRRPESDEAALDDAERSQTKDRLRVFIAQLEPRDRWVAERYYYGHLTMREIGTELGVNESRVSQLHARMLQRMRALMENHL